MADRGRSGTSKKNFFPFDEAHNFIILELVRKPCTHLSREQRVMLQTVEQVITSMAL